MAKKIFVAVFCVSLAVIAGLFLYVRHELGLSPLCGEEIKKKVISPDNNYVAVVYERNCGATTGFVTHINIQKVGNPSTANIYGVIDDDDVFKIQDRQDIGVTWQDGSHLELRANLIEKDRPSSETAWRKIDIRVIDDKKISAY